MRPGHPVGPVGYQRIETGCGQGAKPFVALVFAAAGLNPAQVDGFGPAVHHDVRGGFGILCGNLEFTCVIVAGAGRDDAQRDIGFGQHLQRVGDDAVAAGHDDRIGALLDRRGQQVARILGVFTNDLDDLDATMMQPGDRVLGGLDRGTMSGQRIGQGGHLADAALT